MIEAVTPRIDSVDLGYTYKRRESSIVEIEMHICWIRTLIVLLGAHYIEELTSLAKVGPFP